MIQHLLETSQITKDEINKVFDLADLFKEGPDVYGCPQKNKILATIFREPSTRTRLSFETAMLRLGGNYITCAESSMLKGESFYDTVQVVSKYADIVIVRSDDKGINKELVNGLSVPVINGGTGSREHPTQAIIDLYTILHFKKTLDGLNILIAGDIERARTIKSLLKILELYDNNIEVIPTYTNEKIRKEIPDVNELWEDSLKKADVIYMTRIQKERWNNTVGFANVSLVPQRSLGKEELGKIKKDAIIMSPLPRTVEISKCVDQDSRAVYFEQAALGVIVRMAILHLLLERNKFC